MRTFWLAALLFWLSVSPAAFSADGDDFETAYMPRGRYQGQLLDTRDRRSVRLLDAVEGAAYREDPADIVITNFYHEGRFWIARFPVDCVQAIYFQKVVMKTRVPAAHAQLRFKMKAGKEVRLFPQKGTDLPVKDKIGDVVYSVEAMPVYGDKYDLVNGVRNHFGLGLRFMSIEEAYFKSIFLNDQKVEQIPLDVLDKSEQVLLSEAISRSATLGNTAMYNTITRSCCTESFGLLDRSTARTWLRMPAYGLVVLPILPRTYLWLRQLVDLKGWLRNRTPSLAEEFVHLKFTPGWPERKVALVARDAADRAAFLDRMKAVAGHCDLAAYGRRNDGAEWPSHGSE